MFLGTTDHLPIDNQELIVGTLDSETLLYNSIKISIAVVLTLILNKNFCFTMFEAN